MAAVAAVLACATAGVAQAHPTPPRPAPTSSFATYVAGAQSPHTLVTGGWSSSTDPDLASFSAGGTGLTATRTVVDATWTSRWLSVNRHRPGLFVRAEAEHWSYLPGLADTVWSYSVEERTPHHTWFGLEIKEVQPYDPQFIEDSIWTELDKEPTTSLVQYRVRFHADVQGSYREKFALDVAALGHS